VVPRVPPTTTLDGLLARPFDGARAVLLETPGHPALASLPVDASSPLLLLVGPAGGFEPAEAHALLAAGLAAASLGPRILRAETAALAAVAIAQAMWGDLRV
jgi:16S rRNA (uracil1498-N3)-methyltransferase